MSLFELFLIAVALSMDAFAVSVCKGLSMRRMNLRHALIIGLYFGGFQAFMPLLGYILGIRFQEAITAYDHWIAFILLVIIGGNMIKESFEKENTEINDNIDIKTMILLAVATSIDALAVGITFAFLKINILLACFTILITTCILSILGAKFGSAIIKKIIHINEKSMSKFGGIILILMGLKIAIL